MSNEQQITKGTLLTQQPVGVIPVRASGALASDLTGASKEYTLFVPHVPLMVFPSLKLNPVNYCAAQTGKPDKLLYWETNQRIVDVGDYGRQMGLAEHVIFGVPKEDWPAVENTAVTMMVNDGQRLWHLIIQRCPIQVGSHAIDLLAFALESDEYIVKLLADNTLLTRPTTYSVQTVVGGDSRLAVALTDLQSGREFHKIFYQNGTNQ